MFEIVSRVFLGEQLAQQKLPSDFSRMYVPIAEAKIVLRHVRQQKFVPMYTVGVNQTKKKNVMRQEQAKNFVFWPNFLMAFIAKIVFTQCQKISATFYSQQS
jgi:hypothetical protein